MKDNTKEKRIFARLHVLLAQKSSQAIIIRRGPTKMVATIGWNREDDSFFVGQWLKGRIYPYRSDISPNGKYWIYFAMSDKNKMWTAVAKTPYLKALDFYTKNCTWNGGGLFASSKSYWLNDAGVTLHQKERFTSNLSVIPHWNDNPNYQGEDLQIYLLRLTRDGWTQFNVEQTNKHQQVIKFQKRINDSWQLWKLFHCGLNHPVGKGVYYESYFLFNTRSNEIIEMPNVEWADIDKNRIVWAIDGKIMSGKVTTTGLTKQKLLFDTNSLTFSELTAPY